MQTLSQNLIPKHQWLVHSLYGQKYWDTPFFRREKGTSKLWQQINHVLKKCISTSVATVLKYMKWLEFITTEKNICHLCKSCIHQCPISVCLTPADKWQIIIGNMDKHATHVRSEFHTRKGTTNTECIIQPKRIINIFLQIVGRKRSPVILMVRCLMASLQMDSFSYISKYSPLKLDFSPTINQSHLCCGLHPTLILGDVSEFKIL